MIQDSKKTSPSQSRRKSLECVSVVSQVGSTQKELVAYPATPRGAGMREAQASHTCLTNNYSITSIDKGIATYSDEEKTKEYLHYKEKIEPTLGSIQYKSQNRMQHVVEQAALYFGRNSIGVLDLTIPCLLYTSPSPRDRG